MGHTKWTSTFLTKYRGLNDIDFHLGAIVHHVSLMFHVFRLCFGVCFSVRFQVVFDCVSSHVLMFLAPRANAG